MTERLQKLMARSGLCSRRTAEDWLRAGRVRVNGAVASLGDKADPDHDRIEVDGQLLPSEQEYVYLMLHKPRGYVTTLSDEFGRRTAADLVADCGRRVFPVGRLDMDSEGLLLFTNDGDWMQALLHPKNEINKVYLVTVTGALDRAREKLMAIRCLDGERIRPAQVEEVSREKGKLCLRITIHEGKNRQIRRMCAQVGLRVERLQRVQEHTLQLGSLPSGKWRYLTQEELQSVKEAMKSE